MGSFSWPPTAHESTAVQQRSRRTFDGFTDAAERAQELSGSAARIPIARRRCQEARRRAEPQPPRTEEIASASALSARQLDALLADLARVMCNSSQEFSTESLPATDSKHNNNPEKLLLHREQMGYLDDAIAALPQRLRFVVVGYYLEEHQMSDIAIELAESLSRVSQMCTEATTLIRGVNSQLDPDPDLLTQNVPVAISRTAYHRALADPTTVAARLAMSTPRGEFARHPRSHRRIRANPNRLAVLPVGGRGANRHRGGGDPLQPGSPSDPDGPQQPVPAAGEAERADACHAPHAGRQAWPSFARWGDGLAHFGRTRHTHWCCEDRACQRIWSNVYRCAAAALADRPEWLCSPGAGCTHRRSTRQRDRCTTRASGPEAPVSGARGLDGLCSQRLTDASSLSAA